MKSETMPNPLKNASCAELFMIESIATITESDDDELETEFDVSPTHQLLEEGETQ